MRGSSVISTLLLISTAVSIAQPAGLLRHADISSAKEESPEPLSLMTLYGSIMDLMRNEDFEDSNYLLNEALAIHIPENIRYVMSRFNELLSLCGERLEGSRAKINDASMLMVQGLIQEAISCLKEATFDLAVANRTVSDLETVIKELSRNIPPIFTLTPKVAELRTLLLNYTRSLVSLGERIRTIEEGIQEGWLRPTTLEISAWPGEVEVGSELHVEGGLFANGEPISGRTVHIYLLDTWVLSSITDLQGLFRANIKTPLIYVEVASAYAWYLPSNEDSLTYTPCSSNRVPIRLGYKVPTIAVETPSTAYPDIPFTISGYLSVFEEGLPGFKIEAQAFGLKFENTTAHDGAFQMIVTPPAEIATGSNSIVIQSEPRNDIAPSSAYHTINVKRLNPGLIAESPPVAIAGLPFCVTGRLTLDDRPLNETWVEVTMGESSLKGVSDVDGGFEFGIVPLMTSLSGALILRIGVHPEEAWIQPFNYCRDVLLINPITLAFPMGAAASIIIGLRRSRGNPKRVEVSTPERIEPMGHEQIQVGDEHPQRRAVLLYWQAVELVSVHTSIVQKPHHTLREYLGLVKLPLGRDYDAFEAMTRAAEEAMYALVHSPDLDAVAEGNFSVLRGSISEA